MSYITPTGLMVIVAAVCALTTGPKPQQGKAATEVSVTKVVVLTDASQAMHVNGINESGLCAGFRETNIHQPAHPVLAGDRGLIDMERQLGHDCVIDDVNDRGQLLYRPDVGRRVQTVVWDNGRKTQIRKPGVKYFLGRKINNDGDVVGIVELKDNTHHAFLHTRKLAVDLGTLGGNSSDAYSINDADQIVGDSITADQKMHAFLWESGKMHDLATLGGRYNSAVSVNTAGEAVGMSDTMKTTSPEGLPIHHAVLWSHGEISDLQSLPCEMSEAKAINDHRVVVGTITLLGGSPTRYKYHAFVWYANKMIDLNDLLPPDSHLVLNHAVCINNANQIVAYSNRAVILVQLHIGGDSR